MFKKLPKLTINALMMVLLVSMLVLPITGLGLAGYRESTTPSSEVLSVQDCFPEVDQQEETLRNLEMEREYYLRLFEQMEADEVSEEVFREIPSTYEEGFGETLPPVEEPEQQDSLMEVETFYGERVPDPGLPVEPNSLE